MKKEEKTECTCNNDNILRKVLIAFGCGVLLGALIAVGIFFAVRKADNHRLNNIHHCNGYLRCPRTPIKYKNEYRYKFDSELELEDSIKNKKSNN